MKVQFVKSFAAIATVLLVTAAGATASEWNKKTFLEVSSPIEVPGAVLPPGEYVLKLVDSDANRHIVQFLTEDESGVISTVIAVPNRRMQPTGDTQFAWYETPEGSPPAMRAWFYPGDTFGQEFVYPEGRAGELAQSSQRTLASVRDESVEPDSDPVVLRKTEIWTITPEQERDTDLQAAQTRNEDLDRQQPYKPEREPLTARPEQSEPVTIAQSRPAPKPSPTPGQSSGTRNSLPETAGFAPLLGLIGLSSLAGAAAVGRLRRRK